MQERRKARRYDFVAAISVIDNRSGKEVISVTSDLSRSGCHVRTETPFPAETPIRLQMRHGGTSFDARGKVIYSVANKAMGLAFEGIGPAETAVLEGWIADAHRNNAMAPNPAQTLRTDRKVIFYVCAVIIVSCAVGALAWMGVF